MCCDSPSPVSFPQLREQFCANVADIIRALVAAPQLPGPPPAPVPLEAVAGAGAPPAPPHPPSPRAPLFAAFRALWESMAAEGDVEGVARWRAERATRDGGTLLRGRRGGQQRGAVAAGWGFYL